MTIRWTGREGRTVIHRSVALALGLSALITGCTAERSFPISPERVVRLGVDPISSFDAEGTRGWLEAAHDEIEHLLPPSDPRPLLTADLVHSDGRPVDVYSRFGMNPDKLHTLLGNWRGIVETAQVAQRETSYDSPPQWAGFEDVWIPIGDGVELSGRLGFAKRGDSARLADCIIVLPGILGDKSIRRTQDICVALRAAGLHVLALDLRGLGQSAERQPDVHCTFGILETGDLFAVSEWLESKPVVRNCGIIGFCWGANQALLAAWEDGRDEADESVGPLIRAHLRPRQQRRYFQAGIVAFSPVLRFEEIIERSRRRIAALIDPVMAGLQDRVREHMVHRGYARPSGDLNALFADEITRSPLKTMELEQQGLTMLRWLPYRGKPAGPKLERARTPVLVVHAANDPLSRAQDVADFFAGLRNTGVAGLILPYGGHDGFAAYSSDYFYSLLLNFFDDGIGAAACARRAGEMHALRLTQPPEPLD